MTKEKKNKGGRPARDRDEVLELVTPIALEHAKAGGFWGTLPAKIHQMTGKMMCEKWLNLLTEERPEFRQTKKICFSYCEAYWDQQVARGDCHPSVWIFIKKNIAGWRDKQPGEADVVVNNYASKPDDELDARIAELKGKHDQSGEA